MEEFNPQDMIPVNVPSKFYSLNKYNYSEIFQFLSGKELCMIECLCRRFSPKFPLEGKVLPDYLYCYKLLCQKELCFYTKFFNDSWKQAFVRCYSNKN